MLKSKHTHFVRVFTLQGQFVLGKKNGAIQFYGFTKFISHISFTIIRVNCAFGFVSDYVIVTDIMLFV